MKISITKTYIVTMEHEVDLTNKSKSNDIQHAIGIVETMQDALVHNSIRSACMDKLIVLQQHHLDDAEIKILDFKNK